MFVMSAFYPSFVHILHINHSTGVSGIPSSLCSVSLLAVKTWMEGTNDIPYKNSYSFVTTEPNRMGSYTVRPNKKETRFISKISSLPRKIETNCMLHYQEHFLFFHLIRNT